MTTAYTPTQIGYDSIAAWFDTTATTQLTIFGAGPPVVTGGLQYNTFPAAPSQQMFRSMLFDIVPLVVGATTTGTLTIGLVDNPAPAAFSNANLPSNLATVPLYNATYDFSTLGVLATHQLTCNIGIDTLNETVGNFETALQVLNHSTFNGTVALTLAFTGDNVTCGAGQFAGTITVDDVSSVHMLTGLPSSKEMVSRADYCPRCGDPIFRQNLVEDGFAPNQLVCPGCYDTPERRRRRFVPPKEINP